ncbi:uncharacterized protein [Malus domestica]|uniref:uncharacterized protein n=1 Tax=Malus domestica TaxID=3750 RepID=UPI003975DA71
MCLDVAVKALEALVTFFENYRETGFASAMRDAKEITKLTLFFKLNVIDLEKDIMMKLMVLQIMLHEEAFLSNNPWTFMEIANFVQEIDMCHNVLIAYRVLLTVHVTVVSAERSFSKLKLLKSYSRTTMTQDRLNGLAILCIENDEIEDLEYDDIIDDFASKNVSRQFLKG